MFKQIFVGSKAYDVETDDEKDDENDDDKQL